jgi:hypothetical protein
MTVSKRLSIDPSDFASVFSDLTYNVHGITAYAGGGQANAVQLVGTFNRVGIVGTANDSVKLPVAKEGSWLVVFNKAAANSLNIFPSTGDKVNALSVNAAYALAVTKGALFVCVTEGTWDTILTA